MIDEMLRNGFNFGGEQSGHLIFRDYVSTGDGLVAALKTWSEKICGAIQKQIGI